MALIKVRDKYGNFYDIPGLRGQNGTGIYCGEVNENSIYTVQLPDGFVEKKGDLILVNGGKIWKIIDVTNHIVEETGITLQGPQGTPGQKGDPGEPGTGIEDVYIQDGDLFIKYTNSEVPVPVGPVVESATNKQELQFFPLDDGTYGVAAGNSEYLSKIEIPETYNGKEVTLITTEGFYNPYNEAYISEHTKEIVVPATIQKIAAYAFHSERDWVLIRLKHTDSIPLINCDSFDIWMPDDNSCSNSLAPLVIAVTNMDLYPEGTDDVPLDWDELRHYMVSDVEDKKFSTFSFGDIFEGEFSKTIYLPFFEGQVWGEWCETTLNRKSFSAKQVDLGDFRVLYDNRDIMVKTTEGSWSPIKPTDLIDSNTEYGVYLDEEE